MLKRCTLTLIAILCSLHLIQAQKGFVTGKVTDSTSRQAIPYLSVLVSGTGSGAVTNENGEFTLKLDPGTYELVYSSVEYQKATDKITVTAGETLKVEKILVAKVIEMGIFVKSEGKYEKKLEDVTVTLEVLKPNIVQNKNATSVDQSLQQVPGVTIVDSEPQIRSGSGYSFGAGSRVMVMVDDVPLLSGDAGRPSWGFIPIENLEQIEVIKGASSVLYGSAALNGVINVRTAYPKDKPLTKISTFMGIYNLQDSANWSEDFPPFMAGMSFLHSRKIGRFDMVVGGNLYMNKGYIGAPKQPFGAPDDTLVFGEHDYRGRVNFNTRYRFKKAEGLSIGLNGNFLYSASAGSFIWKGNNSDIYRSYEGAITKTLQTVFNIDPYLSYSGKLGTSYNLRTRYFYLDNNNDNNQANSSNLWFGEFQFQKRFKGEKAQKNGFLKNFVITAGIMSTYTIGKAQLFAGTAPNPPGVDSVTVDRISTDNLNVATYVQLENKFFGRLTVSLGARLEYFRIGKYDRYNFWNSGNATKYDTSIVDNGIQPVFRGGLNFKAAEYTFIRASFGQGYRFPTIAERFIFTTVGGIEIFPNPELRPETSWSAELGVKQGFKIGKFMGYADVAGYVQYYENFIEFNFVTVPQLGFTSLNTGQARVAGIDFSIMGQGNFTKDFSMTILAGYNWSLPQSLSPRLNYAKDTTISTTTYLNTSSDTTNHILKYRFEHTVKLDVEFTYKIVSLGISFRYNSFMQNIDRAFDDLQTANILNVGITDFRQTHNGGDYVIDLRAACQITKNSKISFIINNVANRVYALRPGKVEAPRSFVLQYAHQF